jgi:GAF domain-containing protein
MPPAYARRDPLHRPPPGSGFARALATKQIVHVADVLAEPNYPVNDRFIGDIAEIGFRTLLIVPMLTSGEVIGAIGIFRQEVRPFTDKQTELVSNFAKQAVIAIDNTRLVKELRQRTDDLTESLEQQTATSEVLQVISSSPGELDPVFEAMLERATRICESKFGSLLLYDGSAFRFAATFAAVEGWSEFRRPTVVYPRGNDDPLGRLVATHQLQHVADMRNEPAYIARAPGLVPLVDVAGARTLLAVPMLKEGTLIGAITIYRQEVRPFTDKQIELVQNFARQSLLSRTHAYSTIYVSHCNSKRRHRRSSKSSAALPASFSPCSTLCWKMRRAFALLSLGYWFCARTANFGTLRFATRHLHL